MPWSATCGTDSGLRRRCRCRCCGRRSVEVLEFTVPRRSACGMARLLRLLSLPVIFSAAWIFFDGAYQARSGRTLDMMLLVAVGVGAGYELYSVEVTLTGGGDVFHEAATVLTARSCCSGTGSRCGPAAAQTTIGPAGAHHQGGKSCGTGRRSRSPRPTSRWATCCWSARSKSGRVRRRAGTDPGRRRGRGGRLRGRRVDGHQESLPVRKRQVAGHQAVGQPGRADRSRLLAPT